jgi:hypothetical protein
MPEAASEADAMLPGMPAKPPRIRLATRNNALWAIPFFPRFWDFGFRRWLFARVSPKEDPTAPAVPTRRAAMGLGSFTRLRCVWRTIRSLSHCSGTSSYRFGGNDPRRLRVVAPIHPKAIPVTLKTPAEVDLWASAGTAGAVALCSVGCNPNETPVATYALVCNLFTLQKFTNAGLFSLACAAST